MGLSIEVGILADLKEADDEGFAHHKDQFTILNTLVLPLSGRRTPSPSAEPTTHQQPGPRCAALKSNALSSATPSIIVRIARPVCRRPPS